FVIDPSQLEEARAAGAAGVLLIVAALAPGQLGPLMARSHELGLDVLCEIHDNRELEVAMAAGCDLIGVNSRDLETLQVNLETALRLGPRIPSQILRVAESGIQSAEDIRKLRDVGYQAFLVGESLMRAESPGEALKKLLAGAKA
ncbi:MAG: indole-3-glycerol phosphate synthase TrpC, partial [Terriglobales bacterium]